MLQSTHEVIHALVTYTDWWQPSSTSVLQVGVARRSNEPSEGFRPGLLETLDERMELARRMHAVEERDRHLLLLWYVQQLEVADIARKVGLSRRQCFRRRSRAIQTLVDQAASSASDN
jgi:DNA-directed RNA polymerase specialized sigma subunit